MPSNYIKSLSDKYNISIEELENDWSEAEKLIDKSKYSENDYYPILTSIFKSLINKKYNINESYFKDLKFKQYCIFEDLINHYEDSEMPTKDIQQENQEKYIQSNN